MVRVLCVFVLAAGVASGSRLTHSGARVPAGADQKSVVASVIGETVPMPLGLMWPVFPAGKPPAVREVAVGRRLFFDPALSSDGSVSCASCHAPDAAMADLRPVSIGAGGKPGRRNSPTVLNAVYFERLGWSGENGSLEEQALTALSNPEEMGATEPKLRAALEMRYGADLRDLYGALSARAIARALASFQRTLVAGDAPFDRYIYLGDRAAVSESGIRGFGLFLGKARCIQCHFMRSPDSHPFGGRTGLYMDNRFHNLGVGFENGSSPSDLGRYEITRRDDDRGAFKTPSLRNVALTPPYMHDGSLKTLEDVVEHYNKGGNPNPNLDPDVRRLDLTDQDKRDLVEFMKALTSHAMNPAPQNAGSIHRKQRSR